MPVLMRGKRGLRRNVMKPRQIVVKTQLLKNQKQRFKAKNSSHEAQQLEAAAWRTACWRRAN